ncbi:Phthalate dioxygenase reductase [Variovorax sp. PBL-H6]|uniref:PDR/VanB family oxidoreductase n=1 Tax=Variovorax sp. PBL-H6 TaxID=434009 RepID=UPI001318A19D|nr:PDR/VanB family oxidoreductase [Variovorax sp. PBL-H6]VTU15196.1 Phthalate dioxygenase reductase [Variovorax sp. PBL-H6]
MEVIESSATVVEAEAGDWLQATVSEAVKLTPDTLLLRLRSATGEPLPPHEPGAHVALACGEGVIRHYSLTGARRHPGLYELGIKRAANSLGGSRWVFDHVAVGSQLRISRPRNHFPLVAEAAQLVFLSGGIGATPIISMLYELQAKGIRARLVHMCRSREDLGFESWLSELANFHDVHLHFDAEAGLFDLQAELGRAHADAHVYCCGPTGMMDAVRQHGEAAGRAERFHFEYFAAPQVQRDDAEDGEFTVVQGSTGRRIAVSKTKTMLAALRDAGIAMKSECEYGVCGWCAVGVKDGVPAHFDSYLTAAEKEGNKLVLPCVSRCASASITLDI